MVSETRNEDIISDETRKERAVALDNYAFYGNRKYFIVSIVGIPALLYSLFDQVFIRFDAATDKYIWPFVYYIAFCVLVYLLSFIRIVIWFFLRNDIAFIKRQACQSRINIDVFGGKLQQIVYVVVIMIGANIAEVYSFNLSGKSGSRGLLLFVADVGLLVMTFYYLYRTACWYLFKGGRGVMYGRPPTCKGFD